MKQSIASQLSFQNKLSPLANAELKRLEGTFKLFATTKLGERSKARHAILKAKVLYEELGNLKGQGVCLFVCAKSFLEWECMNS